MTVVSYSELLLTQTSVLVNKLLRKESSVAGVCLVSVQCGGEIN